MSETLQGFVLFLPTIGGQDAVDVLLDGIVFPHTLFQASVLSVQPILFFGQPGIFLAQLDKVGELITDAHRFQRPRRCFKENDFALTSAQILFLVTVFLYSEQWMQIFHLELERYKEAKGDVFLLSTEEADAVIREAGTTFLNAIGPRDYKPDYPHKRGKSTMIEDGRLYE